MKYKILTEEIHRVHGIYFIDANSEEEAYQKLDNGQYDDSECGGDIWDVEITEKEILNSYED